MFEEAIRAAFPGVTSTFLNVWETFHLKQGEVHCGSAAERTPPESWWNP